MLFDRKPKKQDLQDQEGESSHPPASREVFSMLDNLKKAGVQLAVRFAGTELFTSEILGLGRDGFFIDTLTPPSGDRQAKPGRSAEFQSMLEGISYIFKCEVIGKVKFLDELPAFKMSYPVAVRNEARRKNNRLNALGTARFIFMRPFDCDADVVDVGEGGLAFEYPSSLGRLAPGTRLGGTRLDMGSFGTIEVKAEVVGTLVASIGGLSLPSSYRSGVRFFGLNENERVKLTDYLKSLRG